MIRIFIIVVALFSAAISLYNCIESVRRGDDFKTEYIIAAVSIGIIVVVKII